MSDTRYAYDTATNIQIKARWCPSCGIAYGLPEGFIAERERDGKTWFCPNGCKRHYPPGGTTEEKLRRRLDSAEATLVHVRDQRDAAERSARAQKGHATRLRRRAAAGVCPCCSRSFQNLKRHMDGQHPGFAEESS